MAPSGSWPWSWAKPDTPPVVGVGFWWGWLVKAVPGDPTRVACAVPGCDHTFAMASVNAFRVRSHVQGVTGKGASVCKFATTEDKDAAAKEAKPSMGKSAAVPAKRKAVDELVGTNPFTVARGVNGAASVGTSTSHSLQLAPTVVEREEHAAAQVEVVRDALRASCAAHRRRRAGSAPPALV